MSPTVRVGETPTLVSSLVDQLSQRLTDDAAPERFVVGLVGTLIGTFVGAIAGYYRGWVEAVLMRLTDLFIVIPLLVLAAVVGRMTGEFGIVFLAFMLGILCWTGLARLVRGEVLSLREREFVSAARALGASSSGTSFPTAWERLSCRRRSLSPRPCCSKPPYPSSDTV